MDLKSGKTNGTAFAEVVSVNDQATFEQSLRRLSNSLLHGRRLKVNHSTYDEICNTLYPAWRGMFQDGKAIQYSDSTQSVILPSKDSDSSGERSVGRITPAPNQSDFFISQKELQVMLEICRKYKVISFISI
jgi:hypothetical protein